MIALIAGCGGSSQFQAPVVETAYHLRKAAIHSDRYIVRPGDTLYSVAWNSGQDYRLVAQINHIAPPYKIHPGQTLVMRAHGESHDQHAQHAHSSANTEGRMRPSHLSITRAKNRDMRVITNQTTQNHPITTHTMPIHGWRWPTTGKIIRGYAPTQGNKGINIGGYEGQPIYAAADGEVVYSGSGLRGYGKLIIIKHNDEFLSAYAHNKKILVSEGQIIKSGQKIAEMGDTGADRTLLHFEIRKAGKTVNPLSYLGKQ